MRTLIINKLNHIILLERASKKCNNAIQCHDFVTILNVLQHFHEQCFILEAADNSSRCNWGQYLFTTTSFLIMRPCWLLPASSLSTFFTTVLGNQSRRQMKRNNLHIHMHQYCSHNRWIQWPTGTVLRARKGKTCKEKEQSLYCV